MRRIRGHRAGTAAVGLKPKKIPRAHVQLMVLEYPYVDEEHVERDAGRVGNQIVIMEQAAHMCMPFVDEEHEDE